MTEAEAKTKWCPQTLIPVNDGAGCITYAQSCCLASACMAWRATTEPSASFRVHPSVLADHWKGWLVSNPEPDAEGHVEISLPYVPEGYCGLAGQP